MDFEDIKGTVTEDGRVFREDGREYPQHTDKHGYYRISVYNKDDKRTYSFLVHRLVAQFHVPNPEGRKVVNHKDTNKKNNHKDNLEWVTLQDNSRHAWQHGLTPFKPRKGGKRDWRGRFSG